MLALKRIANALKDQILTNERVANFSNTALIQDYFFNSERRKLVFTIIKNLQRTKAIQGRS